MAIRPRVRHTNKLLNVSVVSGKLTDNFQREIMMTERPLVEPEPHRNSGSNYAPDKATAMVEFSTRLSKVLADRAMRPAELARRSGIGRDSISLYLNAKSLPTATSLRKIALALETSASDLLPSVSDTAPTPTRAREWDIGPGEAPLVRLTINKMLDLKTAVTIVEFIRDYDAATRTDRAE